MRRSFLRDYTGPAIWVIFIYAFAALSIFTPVFAQTTTGVAVNVEVSDSSAAEGDIVAISKDGIIKATEAYSTTMYGVIAAAPILSTGAKTDKTKAVATGGITKVKVGAKNGTVNVGDFLTSSTDAGIAQKATVSGYALGKALEKYDDKSKDGLIGVEVNIGYAEIGLTGNNIAKAILKVLGNPENFRNFIRYSLAFVVGVLTFLASAYAFVRFMSTGLTSLGRNPMASGKIIGGMLFSGLLVVILAASGVGVAAAILTLRIKIF